MVENHFTGFRGLAFCLLLKKANDPEPLRNPFLTELYPNCCCSCWAGLYRMSKPFDSPRGCIRHLLWLWQYFREHEGLLGCRGFIFTCLLMFWENPCWCFCMVEHNPALTREMEIHIAWMLHFVAVCSHHLHSSCLQLENCLSFKLLICLGSTEGEKNPDQTRYISGQTNLRNYWRKCNSSIFFFPEKSFQDRM